MRVLLPAAPLAAGTVLRARTLVRPAAAAMLVVLALAACSAPGSPGRTPAAPTATAEAVGTQARQTADAEVRRILAGDPAATPRLSPTPVPRPSCANAIWWYEARAHLGETQTIQGQVVRVRRLADTRTLLEVGQFYPDPAGFAVVVPAAIAEQAYQDRSVCVSGTILPDDGTPTVRAADVSAVVVVSPAP